jgi:hypothetical protein
MGENAAEPFGRVRQAAKVPLSCSIPQPADAGNQPGKQRAALRSRNLAGTGLHTEAARPLESHRAARNSSPPFRLSFLKTMEAHCNRQVLSRRYQFSHPGKTTFTLLKGK